MKIAVVGATGLVGRVMLEKLEKSTIQIDEIIPVATSKSVGTKVRFNGEEIEVVDINAAIDKNPELALFSAGGEVSLTWAPKFAEKGTYVIDNSSAWRMNPENKLIVPEINADELTAKDKIIANPNCSTIQLVMALAPLHQKYGIKWVVVSTYQSVSGSGKKAVQQMNDERNGKTVDKAYPHQIDKNVIPHCDIFQDFGYTKEEWKLINETKKILTDNTIKLTATAVRVPVTAGHSESVNIELKKEYMISDIRDLLESTAGIIVEDSPMVNIYPMPINAKGKDEVFVGRIRRDLTVKNGINLWVVSDNLFKGAATNAVQIAEYVAQKFC
jgi:aspartate-semialdehyde dehydrogenase